MARKYDTTVVREVNGLMIVCVNPTTIYVKHKYGINCYERWFVRQRGFYSDNWKPFRRALTDHRNISLSYINHLADLYNINVSSARKMPDLTNAKIRTVPEWGRARNVH